jgi:hypothetical protein
MKKETQLKDHPFKVPGDYFESFPGRLKERMARKDAPVRPLRRFSQSAGFRLAVAAVFVGLALLSIPVLRNAGSGSSSLDVQTELALLESAGFYHNELEILALLEGEEAMDDDEAYLSQAMEYLAMSDVEMELYYE